MPALRSQRLSVAPVLMLGMTSAPGHISVVIRSTRLMRSGLSGDGGLAMNSPVAVTVILSLASTRTSVACTSSGFSPGRTRQLTVARAVCGSALLAWPPSSRVATQVVRSVLL